MNFTQNGRNLRGNLYNSNKTKEDFVLGEVVTWIYQPLTDVVLVFGASIIATNERTARIQYTEHETDKLKERWVMFRELEKKTETEAEEIKLALKSSIELSTGKEIVNFIMKTNPLWFLLQFIQNIIGYVGRLERL